MGRAPITQGLDGGLPPVQTAGSLLAKGSPSCNKGFEPLWKQGGREKLYSLPTPRVSMTLHLHFLD